MKNMKEKEPFDWFNLVFIGLLVITGILVALKAFGIISISWLWVLSPFLIAFALVIGLILLLAAMWRNP